MNGVSAAILTLNGRHFKILSFLISANNVKHNILLFINNRQISMVITQPKQTLPTNFCVKFCKNKLFSYVSQNSLMRVECIVK